MCNVPVNLAFLAGVTLPGDVVTEEQKEEEEQKEKEEGSRSYGRINICTVIKWNVIKDFNVLILEIIILSSILCCNIQKI